MRQGARFARILALSAPIGKNLTGFAASTERYQSDSSSAAVWLRTCLSWYVILPVATPQFSPPFAPGQTPAMPMKTTAQGKQAAAGDVGKTGAAPVQAPVQKNAFSAFSQLVAQIVAESADPETTPTLAAAAQTVKLPPKTTGTSTEASTANSSDPLAELPAPVRTVPAALTDTSTPAAAPAGGRRAETRSTATSNTGNAQPPSVPVDLNIPIPITPKLQLPAFAGGDSADPKPATPTVVSRAEETAPVRLEPQPILEVKIHLNQPVTETPVVQKQTAPAAQSPAAAVVPTPVVAASATQPAVAASATRGAQERTVGQQNPERGSPDPGDADTGPATEVTGHAAVRTAGNQEAVAMVQQQRPDAGATQPLVHDPTIAPVGALPAPPLTPAPMTARGASTEPQAPSAPLREEAPTDRPKTQQPLRSLALEFAPDGAGDIKVRLSERAGDVHISLHGTDPTLAGRVREGVGDLVGSLSKAGYDAEAWTPGQGRQNQREQPDRRQPAAPDAGAEDFSGILQQPNQEIS